MSRNHNVDTERNSDASSQSTTTRRLWTSIKRYRKRLIVGFILIMHCLGFLNSIRAIMTTRTSQGAIAWAVSLNTFPYLSVPAYWIFGESKFSDYDVLRRKDLLDNTDVGRDVKQILEEEGMLADLETDEQKQQARLLEQLAMLPVTRHNDAQLLIDGEATFDAIFNGIKTAENYILVQFYILRDDGLGRRLKRALIDRARQGVRVYVLYDEIGSYALPSSYIHELREAGVLIHPFNTTQGKGNRFRVNFRNHRKIVVVDGRIAYVGGHNVGDEYLGKNPKLSPWRDTHVALSGPVVQSVQVSFVEDWVWAVGSTPDWDAGEDSELNWQPTKSASGETLALCLPTGPADELETCTLFFLHAINTAKHRLWIVSPYFVPDEQLLSALQLAALRGVDVRILIPENPDDQLVYWSSFSYLEAAEEAGVKIYRYLPGFLHQKVMLIDDNISAIGTANFDNRSMRLNFEITMVLADREFASRVEAMLEQDFANSREASGADYREASFWFRVMVRTSRLMAPVQ